MLFGQRTFGEKKGKKKFGRKKDRVIVVVLLCNGPYQKKPAKVVREEEKDEEDDVSREGGSLFCVCLAPFFFSKERERENATNLEREKTNFALV